jgi:nitrate/nitrite transporter NarK
MVAFAKWQVRQQAHGLPRLIEKSIWKNRSFWALCAINFIIWGTFNACEQLVNLIFQKVQRFSAIDASLMFLPTPISAIIYDVIIGLILHRVSATLMVASTNILSSFTLVMLALLNPTRPYWAAIFPALLFSSVASDASFCVANTMFEEQFPGEMKALASGVFNTTAHLGKAIILAMTTLISSISTRNSSMENKDSPEALMYGYKTCFWFLSSLNLVSLLINLLGLQGSGNQESLR